VTISKSKLKLVIFVTIDQDRKFETVIFVKPFLRFIFAAIKFYSLFLNCIFAAVTGLNHFYYFRYYCCSYSCWQKL